MGGPWETGKHPRVRNAFLIHTEESIPLGSPFKHARIGGSGNGSGTKGRHRGKIEKTNLSQIGQKVNWQSSAWESQDFATQINTQKRGTRGDTKKLSDISETRET